MSSSFKIQVSATTNIGQVRQLNEDRICLADSLQVYQSDNVSIEEVNAVLLCVADGMGGANAGDVASQLACDVVLQHRKTLLQEEPSQEKEKKLLSVIQEAHELILNTSAKEEGLAGMGTTIVIALLINEIACIAWCGDSRGYLFRPGGIKRSRHFDLSHLKVVTDDHSLVWQYVMSGELDPEQARTHKHANVITQSLGDPNATPVPGFVMLPLAKDDMLLICSDGLNGMLPDQYIQAMLQESNSIGEKNAALVSAALDAGGLDNISSILVHVMESGTLPEPINRPEMMTLASDKTKQPKLYEKRNFFPGLDWRRPKPLAVMAVVILIVILSFALILTSTGPGSQESQIVDLRKEDATLSEPIVKQKPQNNKVDLSPVINNTNKNAIEIRGNSNEKMGSKIVIIRNKIINYGDSTLREQLQKMKDDLESKEDAKNEYLTMLDGIEKRIDSLITEARKVYLDKELNNIRESLNTIGENIYEVHTEINDLPDKLNRRPDTTQHQPSSDTTQID